MLDLEFSRSVQHFTHFTQYTEAHCLPANLDIRNIKSSEKKMVTVDTQKDTRTLFEPVVDNPYRLSYVCLMIPRFQSHYLQGDLVEYLHIWIQQICISYGWQLEYLDVQPEYMQWLVNVPVNVSSAIIIRVLRQILSERIFEEFPKFRKQNVGKDFWAPGHLVVVGRQLHSPDTIKEFIRLTRLQQAPGSFNLD